MDAECLTLIDRVLRGSADLTNTDSYLPTGPQIAALCQKVIPILSLDPVFLTLTGSFVVVGDIHGNIIDLLRIFGTVGYPPNTRYLFLGDYVDRGRYAIEVLTLLYSLKVLFPTDLYLLRGNHESLPMTTVYGFEAECLRRAAKSAHVTFTATFKHLPLACVLNSSVFCVHGGISPVLGFVGELSALAKAARISRGGLIADLLWGDPQSEDSGWTGGRKGFAHNFGIGALGGFLARNGLRLMIRAHLTIFSSSDYCRLGNTGAVAKVDQAVVPVIVAFQPLSTTDMEKWRVVFPIWLLQKGAKVSEPESDDRGANRILHRLFEREQ
jgi:protein phosphatase